jgi:hypothetical protein
VGRENIKIKIRVDTEIAQIVPIGISSLALIVSATGLAYQYFYVLDQIVCLPTSFHVSRTPDAGLQVSMHVAISNSGTRTMLLLKGSLVLFEDLPGGFRYHGQGISADRQFPILIQRGEFQSVVFTQVVTYQDLIKFPIHHGTDITGPFEFWLDLQFVNVDGEYQTLRKKACTVRIDERNKMGHSAWMSFVAPAKITYRRRLQDWDML